MISFLKLIIYRSKSFLYGSGTGQRGGARIWLTSEQIHVLGKIHADGEAGDFTGAGASGGTIIMQAPSISIGRKFSLHLSNLSRRC